MTQATLAKKNNKTLTEEDILNSLDAAVAAYSIKDFESITLPKEKNTRIKSNSPQKIKTQKKAKAVKTSKEKKKTKRTSYFFGKPKKVENKITKKEIYKLRSNNLFQGIVSPLQKFYSKYKRQILTLGLTVVMVSFVGFTTYIAYAYVVGNNADIVGKVGAHAVLPTGETPKVYIIQSEKSEIFQNPLFKGIEVGDNVLTYPNAGKVYIYRGAEDKLVNIVNTTQ